MRQDAARDAYDAAYSESFHNGHSNPEEAGWRAAILAALGMEVQSGNQKDTPAAAAPAE
jgi:hypothetical protein